jgi:hypothetical protein
MLSRPIRSWIVLALRPLAAGCFVVGLVIDGHARFALVSVAGAGLLVAAVFRRQAPRMRGALWSSPADLMRGGSRLPGQLSLLSDAVVWTPSAYSRRHGFDHAVRLAPENWSGLNVEAGPALLDVQIAVRSADGQTANFTTHRSTGLMEAIRQLRETDPHQ